MIGIFAEGNAVIGIGHVMRCLTIAEALVSCGEEVIFYSNSCRPLIEGRGFVPESVPEGLSGSENEFLFWQKNVAEKGLKLLLLDSYAVTHEYLKAMGTIMRIAYLDDMNMFSYPVDLLINYNIFATSQWYDNLSKHTEVCLGTKYAPVRKEFLKNRAENIMYTGDSSILLSVGGSDSHSLTVLLAEALKKELPQAKLHVLCGLYNHQKSSLEALGHKYGGINVYENVTAVWEVMKKCNMAVSAAGTTMYELSAMGLPVLTFYFVENQRRIAEGFGQKQAAVFLGGYEERNREQFARNAAKNVKMLAEDADKAERIRQRAMECVDGRGADRIARELIRISTK